MKRMFWGIALLSFVVSVPLNAQNHPIFHVKKVSDEISFSVDLRVGAAVLPAGKYRIDCDHSTLAFTNLATGEKTEMPCLGNEMNETAKTTELYISTDSNGMNFLSKMYLRGSPVEHFFN